METIKTYQHVERSDQSAGFRISTLEENYDLTKGALDKPHRHNFYTVLLVKQGKGEHTIDFQAYPLANRQVYFVGPGQVHQLILTDRPKGFALLFSEEFLIRNHIPDRFIQDLNLFNDFGEAPPLQLNQKDLLQLDLYCKEILGFYQTEDKFKAEAIGALLSLFLIRCNNLCVLPFEDTHRQEAGNSLLRQFKQLLEEHYTEWHASSQYAAALHITPDYLNRSVKSLTGKTAKDFIQSRIVVAAKRLLFFSEMTTKEIGYSLGYSEPGNFSAFFKKCTGISPREFRSKH